MADFQAHLEELAEIGASVYALSTDSAEHAEETVQKLGLRFPVLYGMDGPATAALLGAYYEQELNIIQPVNFVLHPGGTIASITVSSGPIGRVVAGDAIGFIHYHHQ